ncbi:MAG: hypothetical protein E6K53_17290 [Gammaproteobacteria bacterium]|nr:MAG: hypothetical protein E6K53_17290 [Gammaproteobacteria bacterium]
MGIEKLAAAVVALGVVAASAHANNGEGFGVCKSGFADDTVVSTESRGNVTIGELRVDDRVWSYNEVVGKKGWSKVLNRVGGGPSYRILADFTEPGSPEVTKACWIIKPAS